jgi:hypothetical protein
VIERRLRVRKSKGWWRVEREDRRLPEDERWELVGVEHYTFPGAWRAVNNLLNGRQI